MFGVGAGEILLALLAVVVMAVLTVGAVAVLLRRGIPGAPAAGASSLGPDHRHGGDSGPLAAELAAARAQLHGTADELRTKDDELRRRQEEVRRAQDDSTRHRASGVRVAAELAQAQAELTRVTETERAGREHARADLAQLRSELRAGREQLQSTRGELVASQAEQRQIRERTTAAVRAEVLEQARDEVTHELAEARAELRRREQHVGDREHRVDDQTARLQRRSDELDVATAALAGREVELSEQGVALLAERERLAGLSPEQARAELVASVTAEAKREAAVQVRDLEAEARRTGEGRARQIVVEAIQRVASEQTSESVVSVLHLPSDEMKGRIIGREGRNIRTFEQVTGVNVIIDDTPEAVLLSCFDPVRREVGRITLEKLVLDGRIHPHRIEETYEIAKAEIDELCERSAEDALVAVGLTDVHPGLRSLLGRLRYRTSYGQNVLKHLVETAHIAGVMADELHIDRTVLVRGAFLHDVGKALTHETQGSHAIIGAEMARKYGESDDVVHAIEAHHNEVVPRTMEAVLTQAADACSGGRPGARRESLEAYVERLHRIEEIAAGKPGVDKVFAMQAGRQVRVMVSPDDVDDLGAQVLARDIAKQIEEELTYPGQVQVTVVRESRATETAR